MIIKAMTYNICSGRDFGSAKIKELAYCKFDLTAAAQVINKYAPDVCGLNEVRGEGADPDFTAQAKILSELTGMNYYFAPAIRFDGKNPYGNALLTKYKMLRTETVIIPDPEVKDEDEYYETRSILRAELDVPGGLTVLVSHFGLAKSERRNAVDTLLKLLNEIDNPVIFMGDLNTLSDSELLAPVFEHMHDTADGKNVPLTFASYAPEQKIDYIFTKGSIRTVSVSVPQETASDHMPYISELEL